MLRIGELSKQSGLTKRTVDYYTNLGLLEVSYAESNRYRQYDETNLYRIQLIEFYKTKHLTLEEIKRKLETMQQFKDADIQRKIENIWTKLEEAEMDISELKTLMGKDTHMQRVVEELGLLKQANLHSLSFLSEIW